MISGGFDPGANTVDGSEIPRPSTKRGIHPSIWRPAKASKKCCRAILKSLKVGEKKVRWSFLSGGSLVLEHVPTKKRHVLEKTIID